MRTDRSVDPPEVPVKYYQVGLVAAALVAAPMSALALDVKLSTTHYSEENSWSCGVQVTRMWVRFITNQTPTEQAVAAYTGWETGTTMPEMLNALFNLTPNGYYFAQWGYNNKYEAVKGIAWRLEKHDQPVGIAGRVYDGNPGMHYYLMRGYKGTGAAGMDAYSGYPSFSIEGVYVEDSVYGSSYYNSPANYDRIGKYAVPSNTLITSAGLTTHYWTPIGASVWNPWSYDRYRSVEREPTYANNGKELTNTTVRSNY